MAEGNVNLIATLFNLTPRRVQQLANEGMPKADRGNYDVRACTMWYIRYMQGQLLKRQDDAVRDETIAWTRERTRLAKEQAETRALRNAEMRGELVSAQNVTKVISDASANFRQNTLSLGSKVAAECEGRPTAEIKGIIDREARKLIEAFADWEYGSKPSPASRISGTPIDEATAAADGEPVGRRKPNPKPRGKRRAGKVANRKS